MSSMPSIVPCSSSENGSSGNGAGADMSSAGATVAEILGTRERANAGTRERVTRNAQPLRSWTGELVAARPSRLGGELVEPSPRRGDHASAARPVPEALAAVLHAAAGRGRAGPVRAERQRLARPARLPVAADHHRR